MRPVLSLLGFAVMEIAAQCVTRADPLPDTERVARSPQRYPGKPHSSVAVRPAVDVR